MRRVQLTAQDVHQLAQGIWGTMFDAQLEFGSAESSVAGADFITGCIQLSGAWEGAVVLRIAKPLARRLTARMLGLDEPEDADTCDAMGELTNLMAGAAQTLLPAPSELTPPSVIEGKDYKLVFPHSSLVNEVHLGHDGEPIAVLIFEGDAQPAANHGLAAAAEQLQD